jgi:hypothetical protein
MDLCAVHVKNLFHTNSFSVRTRIIRTRSSEITLLRTTNSKQHIRGPCLVAASGNNNNNSSSGLSLYLSKLLFGFDTLSVYLFPHRSFLKFIHCLWNQFPPSN